MPTSRTATLAVFGAAVGLPLLAMGLDLMFTYWPGWQGALPPRYQRVLVVLPGVLCATAFQALPFSSWRWRVGLTLCVTAAMLCIQLAVRIAGACLPGGCF